MTAHHPTLELYGSSSCPYTAELREHLAWQQQAFIEYDVEADELALDRLQRLTGGGRAVPVLVENGVVRTVGWLGRSCLVAGRNRDHA